MKVKNKLTQMTIVVGLVLVGPIAFSPNAYAADITCKVLNVNGDMSNNSLRSCLYDAQWCSPDEQLPRPDDQGECPRPKIIDLTPIALNAQIANKIIPLAGRANPRSKQQIINNKADTKVTITFAGQLANGIDSSCVIQFTDVDNSDGQNLIKNIKILNNKGGAGICIYNHDSQITYVDVEAPGSDGIIIKRHPAAPANANISKNVILGGTITNVRNGIKTESGANDTIIAGMTITNPTATAIDISDNSGGQVIWNTLTGNNAAGTTGIRLTNSSNNYIFEQLKVTGFTNGIAIHDESSSGNSFYDNIINSNSGKDILFADEGVNNGAKPPQELRVAFVKANDSFYVTGLVPQDTLNINIYKADSNAFGDENAGVFYKIAVSNFSIKDETVDDGNWLPRGDDKDGMYRFLIKIDMTKRYGPNNEVIDENEGLVAILTDTDDNTSEFSPVFNAEGDTTLVNADQNCANKWWFFRPIDEKAIDAGINLLRDVWGANSDGDIATNAAEDLNKNCRVDNGESDPGNRNSVPGQQIDDRDHDGIADDEDVCPDDQDNDADGDGRCADVDRCPNDSENDSDDDGICGDVDNCPDVANPDQEDVCSPANPLEDGDGDGIPNAIDNCQDVPNQDQGDCDDDGKGDICDPSPGCSSGGGPIEGPSGPTEPPEQGQPTIWDSDGDGFTNSKDNCKNNYNPDQTDTDKDGIGDICDDNPSTSDGSSIGGARGGCSLSASNDRSGTSIAIYLILTTTLLLVIRRKFQSFPLKRYG